MESREWSRLKEYISTNPEVINNLDEIKKADIWQNAEQERTTIISLLLSST